MSCRTLCLAAVLCALLLPTLAVAEDYVELYIPRVEERGRLLIQMRPIFEALGWTVEWQALNQRIYAYAEDSSMVMWINRREAVVNGETYVLDVPPRLIEGFTFVPLRFVAESTGLSVNYLGHAVQIKDDVGSELMIYLLDD